MPRWLTVAIGAVALAAVLPWHLHVPAMLAAWRVTGNWLSGDQSALQLLIAPVELALGGFGTPGIWSLPAAFSPLCGLLIILLIGWAGLQRSWPKWTPAVRLLLLWVAAAGLGPVDGRSAASYITASHINRYALGAFPAVLALVSALVVRQRSAIAVAWTAVLLLLWTPALGLLAWRASRAGEPFDLAAHYAEIRMPAGGLLIVHGIPSSVVGVARYLSPMCRSRPGCPSWASGRCPPTSNASSPAARESRW